MRDNTLWGRRVVPFLACAVLACVIGTPAPASATILDFEGLACQSQFASFGGFTFSDNWATECDADYTNPTGWNNTTGAPSPVTAAGNIYFDTTGVTLSRATPFNLIGGQASSFLVGDAFDFSTPMSSATLLINGYFNNVFVGSLFMDFTTQTPGYHPLSGSLLGVDRLEFFSFYDQTQVGGLDYWLVDDLNVTDAAVPEPANMLLLGTGLTLLAVFLRSQRRTGTARPNARGEWL